MITVTFLPSLPCDCPDCKPVGVEYTFNLSGVEIPFNTGFERLAVVGLTSKRILLLSDGDETSCGTSEDMRRIIEFADTEPIAVLHNHPDDFPGNTFRDYSLPSHMDLMAAHRLNGCLAEFSITHMVVTRDRGYTIYDEFGLVKKAEELPCGI